MEKNELEKLIKIADLNATNDLRKAMYNSELKAVLILQSINAGAAVLLVNFIKLSHLSCGMKLLFLLSILSYIGGLIASLFLLFKIPDFLEKRYRQNQGAELCDEYNELKKCRIICVSAASLGFILGTILALFLVI